VQVDSYVTMDLHDRAFGVDFEQAVTVLATVISRPERHLAVTDAAALAVGDTRELIPAHGCTTIPLYDHCVALRGGRVEGILPILPRGTRH
jgi:D-serine deaminase-like pyridoxal phosphate-dependent protein